MLVHVAMRAVPGTLLIRDWIEARALWDRLVRIDGLRALVLMPTHDHIIAEPRHLRRIREAARGYALWRNRHRGESGQVWRHGATPAPVTNNRHIARTVRYTLLNPCRDRLVPDPLSWPFSTHRDMVGLAWPPARAAVADTVGFHRRISADWTVDPVGTPLPQPPAPERVRLASIEEIRATVSALTRTPASMLDKRGPAKSLVLRACRILTVHPLDHIAEVAGVHVSTVSRAASHYDPTPIHLVARVLGDPRFSLLSDHPVPWQRAGSGRPPHPPR